MRVAWKAEVPAEPGAYWYCRPGFGKPYIVHLAADALRQFRAGAPEDPGYFAPAEVPDEPEVGGTK